MRFVEPDHERGGFRAAVAAAVRPAQTTCADDAELLGWTPSLPPIGQQDDVPDE